MVLTEKEVNSLSALPPAPGHVHRLGSSQQLGPRPTLGQMQRSDLWLEMLILRSRLELPHCGGYLMAQSWLLLNQPGSAPLPLSRREFDSSASYTKIWNKLSFSLSTFAFGERHPNKTCECSKLGLVQKWLILGNSSERMSTIAEDWR